MPPALLFFIPQALQPDCRDFLFDSANFSRKRRHHPFLCDGVAFLVFTVVFSILSDAPI